MDDAPRWVYADKQLPAIHGSMAAVSNEIKARADSLGIDRTILELVNLRCSQINGCAFCLHLHTHLALRAGESPQRIAVLSAWLESGLFSRVEQAAINAFNRVSILSHHPVTHREHFGAPLKRSTHAS